MKRTYHIKMHVALWVMLGMANIVSSAWAQSGCFIDSNGIRACPVGPDPGGGDRESSGPTYDYGAAQRAREAEAAAAAERQRQQAEAAAAAERQRQQAEAERIERERQAEIKRIKDAEFIRDRDAAANSLKGSTGLSTPQLKGISGTDNYGLKGSGTDPGAQLKSVERHGRETQSQDVESASKTAQKGFDTPGKPSGNLVYPDKKQRQIPPSALDKRVPPEAQKDPKIQQSLAWYRKLDAEKAEKERMIAEIKEKQKTSKDPILAVKIATLNNDVKRANDDQAKVTETVKKQVKNLGFNLVETPEPATTEPK